MFVKNLPDTRARYADTIEGSGLGCGNRGPRGCGICTRDPQHTHLHESGKRDTYAVAIWDDDRSTDR